MLNRYIYIFFFSANSLSRMTRFCLISPFQLRLCVKDFWPRKFASKRPVCSSYLLFPVYLIAYEQFMKLTGIFEIRLNLCLKNVNFPVVNYAAH